MTLSSSQETPSPEALEQRRQAAIAAASSCIQTLKQEFGATEVIVFGSLRGDAPWHWQSDLDLAVRGLSDQAIRAAYDRLSMDVPSWLAFDLVDVESVTDQVRTRILQKHPIPQNKYLSLKIRIQDEMLATERNVTTLVTALAQSDSISDLFVIPALAGYIADFYTGCERISERVAVALDGGLPQGDDWHKRLLHQLAEPTDHRPALWQGSLLLDLNEYRAFRHLDRHRYKLDLQRDRVLDLARQVQPVFNKIQEAIAQFNQWLDQQALIPESDQ